MYHELSLIVLGDITSGWDGSSSHVMPTRIGVVAGIYGCGYLVPSPWWEVTEESRPTSSDPTHKADASPPCRPGQRTLPGWGLAFPNSQSEATMSCQRGYVRWRASMAATPRNPSALIWKPDIAYRGVVGSSLRDYDVLPSFSRNDNLLAPCRHGGQGSAISNVARYSIILNLLN